MATINGSGGDDTINGTSGDDSIDGAGGNDSIASGGGNDSVFAGAGNDAVSGGIGHDDSIDGDDGHDSLSGGDGKDTIDGGAGDDSIDGGAGDDSLVGGAGSDTIEGGSGNDVIIDDSGDDSLSGGDGNDSIYANEGKNTIEGGDGDDYVAGGLKGDQIKGGAGADTIYGNGGDDTIFGGADNDTVFGGAGNDQIIGGDGADSLDGGDGNDTIEGGAGDDTMQGGSGSDTFVIRDGHGSDRINGFGSSDIIAFDMAEITSYQDVLDRLSGSDSTRITFDNGDVLLLQGFERERIGPSNFAYSAGPVCLLEGTPIRTERGEIAIEFLRPDDIVWTKDNGWQAIRLVTFETMVFNTRDDPAKPVLIPAGALGDGLPLVPLITSPQHRVLQSLPETGEEILVPAVKLIGQNGIRRMRGKKRAVYLNVVMQRHSIIQAAGCWVESLLVTSRSLERQHKAARRLLADCKDMSPARRIVRRGVRPRRLKSA